MRFFYLKILVSLKSKSDLLFGDGKCQPLETPQTPQQDCISQIFRYFLRLNYPFTQISYGPNVPLQPNLYLADQLDRRFGRIFIRIRLGGDRWGQTLLRTVLQHHLGGRSGLGDELGAGRVHGRGDPVYISQ